MLSLWIFVLIPAVLAADYGKYGSYRTDSPSNLPTDYNEGLKIKPDTNFVYNFEQLRRDQPPQVEMREENIGKYMYRPTTTAEPTVLKTSRMPINNRMESQPDLFSQFANILPPVNDRYNQQWGTNQVQSTVMPPPPPAPKLNDFSKTFNSRAFSYFDENKPNPSHNLPAPRDFYNYQSPEQQPMQVPASHDSRTNLKQPSASSQTFSNFKPVQTTSTTVTPSRQNIDRKFADFSRRNQYPSREQQPVPNRGSHKFNWNDISTPQPQYNSPPQQQSTMSLPAVNQNRGPPPPAPTLSPWNDGFGK